jgi:hypothetical protein
LNRARRTCSRSGVTLVSWDQEFFDPIILPGQKPLVTLRDAAQYIIKLPKAERELRQWETAIEWLMLVGENGGDPMVPRIATMKHCNGMSQILCRDLHRAGNSPKAYTLIR